MSVAAAGAGAGLAACGSSNSTSTTSVAQVTASTSSRTAALANKAPKKTKAPKKKSTPPKPKPKPKTTTTSTTTSTTSSTTTTSTTTTTTHPTTTHSTTTTSTHTTPALAPLPSPFVSGSSGQMRASLHGENHTPLTGVKWEYQVEATNAQGQGLNGTVLVQFLFNGSVVGKQSPPTEPMKDGKLIYKNTFPPDSKGIPLTFEAVVTTPLGTVTLNWPVKSHT
jgi:hypothetical protein